MFLVEIVFEDADKVTPALTAKHRENLKKHYSAGRFLVGGRKIPPEGGVILADRFSKEELVQVMSSDPLIASGAARFLITEFEPVMASEPFTGLLQSGR